MSEFTYHDRELYHYAMACALSTLVEHAIDHGRGWKHWLYFEETGKTRVIVEGYGSDNDAWPWLEHG